MTLFARQQWQFLCSRPDADPVCAAGFLGPANTATLWDYRSLWRPCSSGLTRPCASGFPWNGSYGQLWADGGRDQPAGAAGAHHRTRRRVLGGGVTPWLMSLTAGAVFNEGRPRSSATTSSGCAGLRWWLCLVWDARATCRLEFRITCPGFAGDLIRATLSGFWWQRVGTCDQHRAWLRKPETGGGHFIRRDGPRGVDWEKEPGR